MLGGKMKAIRNHGTRNVTEITMPRPIKVRNGCVLCTQNEKCEAEPGERRNAVVDLSAPKFMIIFSIVSRRLEKKGCMSRRIRPTEATQQQFVKCCSCEFS
jgi:hypothetical protein